MVVVGRPQHKRPAHFELEVHLDQPVDEDAAHLLVDLGLQGVRRTAEGFVR